MFFQDGFPAILHLRTVRPRGIGLQSAARTSVAYAPIVFHMAQQRPHHAVWGGVPSAWSAHSGVWLGHLPIRRVWDKRPSYSTCWKGFRPSHQLNLVAGDLKKKKKGTNYTWEGERKMQWASAPSWCLLLTQRKIWPFSKTVLLLWYQLPLGHVYKSRDCPQSETRFLLIVGLWEPLEITGISLDISSTQATLVLLVPAWALGHVIMARYY